MESQGPLKRAVKLFPSPRFDEIKLYFDRKKLFFMNYTKELSVFYEENILYVPYKNRKSPELQPIVNLIHELYGEPTIYPIAVNFNDFSENFTLYLDKSQIPIRFMINHTETSLLQVISQVIPLILFLEKNPRYLKIFKDISTYHYILVNTLVKLLTEIPPIFRQIADKVQSPLIISSNQVTTYDPFPKVRPGHAYVSVNNFLIYAILSNPGRLSQKIARRILHVQIADY